MRKRRCALFRYFRRFNPRTWKQRRAAPLCRGIMHFRFSLNCSRRQRSTKIGRLFSTRRVASRRPGRPAPDERRRSVLSIAGDLVLDNAPRVCAPRRDARDANADGGAPPMVAPIRHVIATSVYASLILINFSVVRYRRLRTPSVIN